MEPDNINAPDHYTKGGIETIDYIKAKLTPEEYEGYLKGNVLKYLSREHEKGGLDDLKKARVYLDWLIESRTEVKNVSFNIEIGGYVGDPSKVWAKITDVTDGE